MTDTEPAREPDTPIAAVTPERVAEILESENLQYRLEDVPAPDGRQSQVMVRTGFVNVAISFAVDEEHLTFDSMWRGTPVAEQAPKLLAAVNEWNLSQFTPTLRFFEATTGKLALSAQRQINTTYGMSRNQIGAFVMSTLDAVNSCFQWVESEFPELVTWEEPHHEH
ncbi:YbjN domain-containing protein [Corynebacterium halotolerans]|uniref:YbjN domain-containing protein n=1 Tax=Corynebacterium halotolerans TaxID=225326 RepID=UPI003CEAEB00